MSYLPNDPWLPGRECRDPLGNSLLSVVLLLSSSNDSFLEHLFIVSARELYIIYEQMYMYHCSEVHIYSKLNINLYLCKIGVYVFVCHCEVSVWIQATF